MRIVRADDDRRVPARDTAAMRRPVEESHTRLTELRRALGALGPARTDAVVAVAVAAEFAVELLLLAGDDPPRRAAAAALLAVMAAALAFRRRVPVVGSLVVAAGFSGLNMLGGDPLDQLYLPVFAFLTTGYTIGRHARDTTAVAGGVGLMVFGVLGLAVNGGAGSVANILTSIAVVVGGPFLVGRLLRHRARLNAALEERRRAYERSRSEQAEHAVNAERERVAGELHDVVGHALGAMTIQAAAARRFARFREEHARTALTAVESTGREALAEIRRLLGVLRAEDADVALAPQPTLRHLGELVRGAAAGGLAVEVVREGDLDQLPTGVDLIAYRVVQEYLGAAVQEGRAPSARVRVWREPDAVGVEVAAAGTLLDESRLLGIRERVAYKGGRLTSAPGRLAARLPLDGAPVPGQRAARVRDRVAGARAPVPPVVAPETHAGWADRARRWRSSSPLVLDAVLAALAFVACSAEILAGTGGAPAGEVLFAFSWAVPLAFRRPAPVPAALCLFTTANLAGAVAVSAFEIKTPFVISVLLAYSVGAHARGRGLGIGVAILVVGILALAAQSRDPVVADFIFPTAFQLVALLAGRTVRGRTALTEQLHEAAARAAEAHATARRLAARDERRRIAREMHDAIAHSISVMVVQAGGARRILDRDPGRTEAAAGEIERTGREAMTEMRRLLGLLTPEEEPGVPRALALAPQPTLAAIGELVAGLRAGGRAVSLVEEGERRPLGAGLGVTAYRVVQDALGGGASTGAAIAIRWQADEVALDIAGATADPHALLALRERVRLHGGRLETADAPDGVRSVSVHLPAAEPAPAA